MPADYHVAIMRDATIHLPKQKWDNENVIPNAFRPKDRYSAFCDITVSLNPWGPGFQHGDAANSERVASQEEMAKRIGSTQESLNERRPFTLQQSEASSSQSRPSAPPAADVVMQDPVAANTPPAEN